MSRSTLPWYKHCPIDHLVDTADLTAEEDGALLRMRGWSWINGPLPEAPTEVAKLIRTPRKVALVSGLLQRFFTQTNAGYIDEKLEAQRQHAETKRAKLVTAGTAGAASRWSDGNMANATADAMPNAIATPKQKLLYARSDLSIGGISTDLIDSTEEEIRKLRPVGGAA
ncbi:MAG: DUF1376 domain-containing protein [Gammaproteobacteria bacterium]|nr:DUF1376 domain-containing protein [Gammaproteobacteria bacterium]